MYLIDANVILEVLYKRERWEESLRFLNAVKRGSVSAYVLHFALHGISAILGRPALVSKFLAEVLSWRGLSVVDLSVDEELAAAEIAERVGLDFDDGLHYYFAKKARVPIVSFDRDFDRTDIRRLEPAQVGAEQQ